MIICTATISKHFKCHCTLGYDFSASISRLVRSADINLQKENGIQIDFYHAAKTNGLCSNTSMSSSDQSTDAYGMHGESRNVLHFLLDNSEQFPIDHNSQWLCNCCKRWFCRCYKEEVETNRFY